MSDKYALAELQIRVLTKAGRFPRRLDDLVERINGTPRQYQENEILGAIDYLVNKGLLLLRTPNNTKSRTLFTALTDRVPRDTYGIMKLVFSLNGLESF